MSTELRFAAWPVVEGSSPIAKVRTLVPMRADNRGTSGKGFSRKALMLVALAHVLAFAALITVTPEKPEVEEPMTPMMVSLVSNPAPETVKPEPPKPQPEVKKPRPIPKPKVVEAAPTPQAVQPEQTAVAAETPSVRPVAAKTPEIVEKPAPKEEPAPETKIEPPRFGAAYLHNPAPDYPALSRRMGEQGKVILRVLVTADGAAETVQIETGSGSQRLDQAAMEAVKKWRFIPAKRNNQPLSAYVLVPVKFSLEN